MSPLETTLQYMFLNPQLLEQALTHKSFFNENRGHVTSDNERLEFLGDAVLGLCLGDLLMRYFPEDKEGQLSKKRAALANEDTLYALAMTLHLHEILRLGRGEQQTGGALKPRLLASALEAVLGAIYRDGGLFAAQHVIERLFGSYFDGLGAVADFEKDYKTRLQELTQKQKGVTPTYRFVSAIGPEHDKVFEIEVSIDGVVLAQGSGKTKKQAEQAAAKKALEVLNEEV